MKIKDICWKNTYLFAKLDEPCKIALKAKDLYGFRTTDDDERLMHINIASLDGKTIPEGDYDIVEKGTLKPVSIEPSFTDDILSLSRVFSYGEGAYSLNITFSAVGNEDDSTASLVLSARYMMRNNKPEKKRPFFEGKGKRKLSLAAKYCAAGVINAVYHLTRLFNKGKKSVLFLSENRDALSENMHAVYDRMTERGMDKEYSLDICCKNIFNGAGALYWIKTAAILAKHSYVFVDDYTPILNQISLGRDVTITQLWHAGFGFKLVGYGRFGYAGSPHAIRSSHRKYTYGIVGCESLKEIYSEVWGIPEERLIASGLPRLDGFLDEKTADEARERLYSSYPELKGKKYFVFAPTYRGISQDEAYYDFKKVDFKALYALCEKLNMTCVFKMHHFIKETVPIPAEFADRLIEMRGLNINDLYYDAELLITDYSSCFYDFALLKKPMLFYVYDKDYYCLTRGVHRPLEKVAPGKLCMSFDELLRAIEEKDYQTEKLEGFYIDRIASGDGLNSDKVIDKVFKAI